MNNIHTIQQQVKDFHKAFDILINNTPTIVDDKTKQLRISLIEEEFDELKEAMLQHNIVDITDGLADLLYVIYGTAISYGINMKPISDEVHRSNMTKVGGYKREDGKWIKPNSYESANLRPILEVQMQSKENR